VLWIAPQPILDFADSVSDAVDIPPARWALSLAMPSKQGANGYTEQLGGRRPIRPTNFKVRPTPPAHVLLLSNKSGAFRMSSFRNGAKIGLRPPVPSFATQGLVG